MNSSAAVRNARTGPIGILSGTGPAGIAVAKRLVAAGQPVVVGSRDLRRSTETVDHVRTVLTADNADLIKAGTNADAAGCSLVVAATKAGHALASVEDQAPLLADKLVVSMAASVVKDSRGMRPAPPPGGPIAVTIAQALPTALVVAALHRLPAQALGDLTKSLQADLLICGDDAQYYRRGFHPNDRDTSALTTQWRRLERPVRGIALC